MVPILYSSLYLVYSAGHCNPTYALKASNPPMLSPINYFNFIPSGQMVSLFLPYMVCHMNLNPTIIYLFFRCLIRRNNDKLEFRVYHKSTCKNDHIHFYSYNNTNTKRGIIIGFYIKILHICFPKYLDEEFNHIGNSFLNLLYTLLNLKPLEFTTKIDLKLPSTHFLIK